MKDIKLHEVNNFIRERGLASLTCYETSRNVLNNDWVKVTTHPRFADNTIKLWYSVMMYHFLSQAHNSMH